VIDYTTIRPHVSDGSIALIKLAFGNDIPEARIEQLKTRYLQIYNDNLAVDSALFDGMPALLDSLDKKQIKWGWLP